MIPACTLLMITHNRRAYTELSLQHLLAGEGDFAVWLWDNGSIDGTADLVRQAESHPRVARVHLSPENRMQAVPFRWLRDESESPIIGKVDDDCLMPPVWIDPISAALRAHDRLGVVGCWTFWPDDFNEAVAAPKIQRFGEHRLVTNIGIGGSGVLVRRELCHRFFMPFGSAMPVHQYRLSAAGFVNGWYYPLIWSEHMDDPRSAHCALRRPDGMTGAFALTAKRRGHRTPEEYERWIREDCAEILRTPTERQIRRWRRQQLLTAPRRAARAAKRALRRVWGGSAASSREVTA